jgi:uncharacterized protein
MKYLLVLIVVVVGLWLRLRQRDGAAPEAGRKRPSRPGPAPPPAEMLACAHCDLRLPRSEALMDPQGRPYCSDAHRLAGPR